MKLLTDHLELYPKTDIIFDFDETIFEILLPWERCYDYGFTKLRDIDRDLYDSYDINTVSWAHIQNVFVQKHGLRARDIIVENNKQFETREYQGVREHKELIEYIRSNTSHAMHIWSSNTYDVIAPILDEYALSDAFATIVTRSNVDFLKPHPDGYSRINMSGRPVEDYLFVGDSTSDEGAAAALGIDFLKVAF